MRNLQRARSAKFPAQDLRASQITGTRCRASRVGVLIRNCSRLSYLLLHLKGYESLRTDKRKTRKRFSPPDFIERFRAVRNLQRARSAKFPAQDLRASPIKEKRASVFRLTTYSNKSEQCATCNEREARSSPRRICERLKSPALDAEHLASVSS